MRTRNGRRARDKADVRGTRGGLEGRARGAGVLSLRGGRSKVDEV